MLRRRLVIACTVLLCGIAPVLAQPAAAPAPAISAEQLMSVVRTLASPEFEGRGAGTPGGLKARAFVEARFKALKLEPLGNGYLQPFTPREGVQAANILGLCKGTQADARHIVVSAHYDHVGIRNGATYHGADDNASGVAVLLALAEQCMREPFRHPIIFAAFDAEEGGLRGARHFIANPPVPLDRIALNVNMDMVARGDKGELYAAGGYHYPWTTRLLEPVAKTAPVKLLFGHDRPELKDNDWTMQSDHGTFHQAKIPFVYFGVEDHPDYHKPTDTPEKIDPVFFRKAAETILAAIRALDAGLASGR